MTQVWVIFQDDDAYDRFEALVGEYEAQRKADAENDSDYYAG